MTARRPRFRWLGTVLRHVLGVPVALLLLFEEWGWESLKHALTALSRWRLWAALSRRIATLPPWAALAAFAIPVLLLEPVKLLALVAFARGHWLSGGLVIVAAKIGGTALLAWLYQLTEPQLLQLAWFARFHAWWVPWKNRLMEQVRQSRPWRYARRLRAAAGRWLAALRARWHTWQRRR